VAFNLIFFFLPSRCGCERAAFLRSVAFSFSGHLLRVALFILSLIVEVPDIPPVFVFIFDLHFCLAAAWVG